MRRLLTILSIGAVILVSHLTLASMLAPEQRHGTIAYLIMNQIKGFHYARTEVDDELSSAALDRYIETLDPNRSYFLASDIAEFEPLRYDLDRKVQSNDVEPAFRIFNRFIERRNERVEHALSLLQSDLDFTVDERFYFDRSEAAWATSSEELDEIWRKRVKNDLIGLMLADRSVEDAAETLADRYRTILERTDSMVEDDVFELFINAFTRSIDPHTNWFNPDNAADFEIEMSASVEGIGATLNVEDEMVTVVEVIPGGPADLSDVVKPGDRIVGVAQGEDGELEDVVGWRLRDVVRLIRGPKDSVVRLRILPAGAAPGMDEAEHSIVRDKVKIEARAAQKEMIELEYDETEIKVGVITIPSFYTDSEARGRGDEDYISTTRDVRRLVGELEAEGMQALVVDLRNNGGGSLPEARELTGLFIDEGPVVQLRWYDNRTLVQRDEEAGSIWDGPMSVLVNRASASASEIFAGALQDYGRAVIVGQRTYGKGTVQSLVPVTFGHRFSEDVDYGTFKFTGGKYYRVTGSSTQHRGVVPDVELPSAIDEEEYGESAQPSALPWDEIDAVAYNASSDLAPVLPVIRDYYQQRNTQDSALAFLEAEIEAVEARRNRDSVSLVLEQRRAARAARDQERLDRENAYRTAMGKDPLADIEALREAERDDVVLHKAAEIVADLTRLNAAGRAELSAMAQKEPHKYDVIN